MRGLNRASDSQWALSRKRSHSHIVEIDSWMPSELQDVSPTVDRLMRLIEGSGCVQGAERDVELALSDALENAIVHGNQAESKTKVHIRCRCGPGKEISIIVTHQGKGFDFGKTTGNCRTSGPAGRDGCGELMKVAIGEVSFERVSTEVYNGDSARSSASLKSDVRAR
jgi:serine/threonine-protein kinase RsbW